MAVNPQAIKAGLDIALTAGQGALSIFQMLKGGADNSKATLPQLEDPSQVAFLSDIERKRKALLTGSATSAFSKKIANKTATIANSVSSVSAGDSSGALTALSRIVNAEDNSVNNLLADSEKQSFAYTQMQNDLLERIAKRKMELQLAQYSQLKTQGTGMQMAGMDNAFAAAGQLQKLMGKISPKGDMPINELPSVQTPLTTTSSPSGLATDTTQNLGTEISLPTNDIWSSKMFGSGFNSSISAK